MTKEAPWLSAASAVAVVVLAAAIALLAYGLTTGDHAVSFLAACALWVWANHVISAAVTR